MSTLGLISLCQIQYGLGPKAITAPFRKIIKDELAVAVATGVARMLTMVGAPA